MTAITKFARLSWREKLLVIRAAAVLAGVKAGLMILGFDAVRRITSSQSLGNRRLRLRRGSGQIPDKSRPSAEAIAHSVESASGRVPGASNCLVRALATEYLLRRYCYPCDLRIGAKRGERGEFAAHAWLESDGRVLIGDFELDTYAMFASKSSRTAGSHQ